MPFPEDRCVHALVAQWAATTPGAPAVECAGTVVDYAGLDRRAARVARALVQMGVGPDRVVGIHLGRSIEAVVVMLGVLKAGGAFLPVDPALPPVRVARMLEESGARWLVDPDADTTLLPPGTAVVTPQALEDAVAAPDGPSGTPVTARPADAAYVLFTSGSTGRPKGVVVEHRALANKAATLNALLGSGPATRHAGCAPVGFDPWIEQVFCPLVAGGTLVVVPDADRDEPQRLVECLRRGRVTVLDLVPDQADQLLTADCGGLRLDWLLVGGDTLPAPVARRILASGIARGTWNLYGPTEACIDATACRLEDDWDEASVPIGRPMPNYRAYVLDGALEPVPVGVAGELWLGGVGLARGYAGRLELTAERFLPDPHAGVPGARMYRTGDRARWRHDGVLEFLGRSDRQVKVRGVRVECGEVEAVLAEHPRVRQAVVEPRADAHGTARLVAWVVPQSPGEAPPVSALLRHVRDRVPSAMVPSQVVYLDALPTTASGKPDRASLVAPEPAAATSGTAAGAGDAVATTVAEALMLDLWRRVLGVARVGLDDNFFDLGGQSLLSMRLMEEVRRGFGVALPVRVLSSDPTVRELSRRVRQVPWRPGTASAPGWQALQPSGNRPPLFVFPAGPDDDAGLVAHAWLARRHLDPDQPVHAWLGPANDGAGRLAPGLRQAARMALEGMRRIHPSGPRFLVGLGVGGNLAFEVARQAQADGEKVSMLALADCPVPRPWEYARQCRADPHRGSRQFVANTLFLALPWCRGLLDPAGPGRFLRLGPAIGSGPTPSDASPGGAGRESGWQAYQAREVALRRQWARPRGRFEGTIDLVLSPEFLGQGSALGWQAHARGGAEVLGLPGNASTCLVEGGALLAALYRRRIDGAMQSR